MIWLLQVPLIDWGLRAYGTTPEIWDGDSNCEHIWGEHRTPAKGGHTKPDNMPTVGSNKAEQDDEMSIRFGYKSDFCQLCSAWRGELGLEPTFNDSVSEVETMELRSDLTDDQKREIQEYFGLGVLI